MSGPSQRRRWGQHFLVSTDVACAIVDWADIEGSRVLEIGPGRGALTDLLVERAAFVRAIEIDPTLQAELQRRYALQRSRVEIVGGDVLAVGVDSLLEPDMSVVANLPYESATAIMRKLLESRPAPRDMVLMVQREVCQRLAASPGSKQYGLLSLHVALRADIEPGRVVPPGCFRPQPRVDSQVVRLRPLRRLRHEIGSESVFAEATAAAFGQRRKMLRNTLLPYAARRVGSSAAIELLVEAGIDPSARPESVPLESFARFSHSLHSRLE